MNLRKISLFLLVMLAFSYTSQENTTQPEIWKTKNYINKVAMKIGKVTIQYQIEILQCL